MTGPSEAPERDLKLHELAFEVWAQTHTKVSAAEIEEARETGQPLVEALVLQGKVDFQEVMECIEPLVALRCQSCEAVHYVGSQLREIASEQNCTACGDAIGRPAPLVDGGVALDAKLAEQAFHLWVVEKAEVDSSALDAAASSEGPLLEALVFAGHLSLEQAMRPLEHTTTLCCEGCQREFHLGAGYCAFLARLRCPSCGASGLLPRKSETIVVAEEVKEDGTLVNAKSFGGCLLERLLGRGGMGEVYLARDENGEQVAVKTLTRQLLKHPEILRRFDREVRTLERVRHENVVRVHRHGVDEASGRPYVVMDYVEGADLQHVIRRRPKQRLDAAEGVYVLRECASGLQAVHDAKILHRDLKPSNVLLGADGTIKLMDFGIALEDDVSIRLTAVGEALGTPQYVPPEALLANEWTTAGDVYALGVMAYRLLSGQPPFPGTNLRDVLLRKVSEPPVPLRELNPEIGPGLADLVHRLMAEDPLARPSLTELQAELDEQERSPLEAQLAALGSEATDRTVAPGGLHGLDKTLQPGQRFQNYRLEGELGRGGMGIVYRAHHLGLKKTVALKLLLRGALASDEDRKRFLREAEAVGALEHPGIVSVLDAGESDDVYYLTMDYVEGEPLDVWCGEQDQRGVCQVVSEICDAIHHAHNRGVIHRDLKPDNVIVDAEGHPHVLDFGIAKRIDRERPDALELTTQGDIMGTLRYMPPEQAEGRAHEVDVRSDVYALGSILYEQFAGSSPFSGNMHQLLQQIMYDQPRAPSTVNPEVPWELDAICLKALEKEPDRRYQSAVALRHDLQNYLEGRPIEARRATPLYRVSKWIRRNKAKAALAMAAALLVAAAPISVLLQRQHAERTRHAEAVEHTRVAWEHFKRQEFRAARDAFLQARGQVNEREDVALPPAVSESIPEQELQAEFVSHPILDHWKQRAIQEVKTEEALKDIAAAYAFWERGERDKALSKAELAWDRLQAPELRALFALFADDRLPEVARLLERDTSLRSRTDDEAFRLRQEALSDARDALRAAEQHDKRAAGASADTIAQLRAKLSAADTRVGADRLIRTRVTEARQHLLNAVGDGGFLKQAASSEPEEAARLLRQAKRELSVAISLHGELDGVREGLTEVSLAGAELALEREQLELARLELEDARIYGLLGERVEGVEAQIAAQDERLLAFKRELARADRAYGEERYAEALASYDLALSHREDPVARARRDLSAGLLAVGEAQRSGDLDAERKAVIEVIDLHPDPKRWRDALARLNSELYQRALTQADAVYAQSVQRGAGWQEAAEAYERALRYDPDGARAHRLRADAYAERDRPADLVLVSIPQRLLTSGAAAARISEREALRFYVERTEVTNAHFARFVAAGGYSRPKHWRKTGWELRADFVDATGRPGPASWSHGKPLPGSEAHPVNGISYYEARAYASFRGRRLPTEREWALAACFDPQSKRWRRFPSGDEFTASPAFKSLRAAGRNPLDLSPWGAQDMGFNVSEWVRRSADDPRPRVIGLSAFFLQPDVDLGVLNWRKEPVAKYRNEALGFRCAADVPPPPAFSKEEGQ